MERVDSLGSLQSNAPKEDPRISMRSTVSFFHEDVKEEYQ